MNNGRIEIAELSLLGNRKQNQDRCSAIRDGGSILLSLADGMGGHPKGDRAAEILMDTCHSFFHQIRKPIEEPEAFLTGLLHQAHERIVNFGAEHTPPIDPRTTAVIALIQDGTAYWAHVGDSRLYLFREGSLVIRTRDHTYLEQIRQNGIPPSLQRDLHLTRNFLTRSLGGERPTPDVTSETPMPLQDGDVVLLCSDGFWGPLNEVGIGVALGGEEPLDQILTELVRLAETNSAPESDNITAIGLRWRHPEPAESQQRELHHAIDELNEVIDMYDNNKEQP